MHWIDATLLTIFSTVACAIFPKLLSVIVNFSTQKLKNSRLLPPGKKQDMVLQPFLTVHPTP
jgi:hypothetical protein